MRVDRVVVGAVALSLISCGGARSPSLEMPEGAASPEQSVETFLAGVSEAKRARAAGEFTEADRAYERMASVFGTERGSIHRSFSAEEVRSRMLVLAACLRPTSYRIISAPDPQAFRAKRAQVTVELKRGTEVSTLPFRLVYGRGERWFIEQIDVSSFSC